MVLFGVSDGLKVVSGVHDPLIAIVWIQLVHVGLNMLSASQHLAHSEPNLSILQMAILGVLPAARTW